MTPDLRRRIIAFCSAIAVVLLLVGWSAFTASREVSTLRRRFTSAQFESFEIAQQLQSRVLKLNSLLLASELNGGTNEWSRFQQDSEALNDWIDQQRDALNTDTERSALADIDVEYDRYLAVAQAIRKERSERGGTATNRIHQLDTAAQRMFALGARLGEAHRHALGDLLGESQHSLSKLETIFAAGLVAVLAVGAWGARIFFQETIAPLRTQLIETQALAARHEKLASLGVLAAGVAHEIRNPLTAIKLRAYMLRQNVVTSTEADEDLTVIDGEIDRLERIVSDFLLFARPSDPELGAVEPSTLLEQTRVLLAPELAEKAIALTVETDGDEMQIRADERQLKQVLINLVRNAADSIGRDGRIVLRTRRDRITLEGKLQDTAVLEVADSGAGIPADVQERLFDPFFTTKPTGTGLGLSIAMRIMERHGGTLEFQTTQGHGTTFGLVLPLPA